jgi:hypothetical protein
MTITEYKKMAKNNTWQKLAETNGHYIWERLDSDGERMIYNSTKADDPPETTSGFYDLSYLYQIRRIKVFVSIA